MVARLDIKTASERLARNGSISDYDFWRLLKDVENEIFRLTVEREPLPIDLLRWRAVLRQARRKRGRAGS